jgi:hypothetical protein
MCFLHAEPGQVMVFDLPARCARIDLDGTLGVLDECGKRAGFQRRLLHPQRSAFGIQGEIAGDYFVRVAGTEEEGSKYSSYRLIAGAVPYAWRMLPVGARRGAADELRIAGVNLDKIDRLVLGEGLAEGKVVASQPEALTFRMTVPASVGAGRYELHAFTGTTEAPLTIPILVSDLAEQLATPARLRESAAVQCRSP